MSNNIVVVNQDTTNVVTVVAQGPQGAVGPAGSSSTFDSGSYTTTSSFNTFTSSYQTDSSSFSNKINSLTAATSSYVQNSQTSSFATTGSNTFVGNQIISGSLNISGSLTQNGHEVKPYKVYTALLTQTGGAPDATVLENTLGTITWEYNGQGSYIARSSNLYTSNMTVYVANSRPYGTTTTYVNSVSDWDSNRIFLYCADLSDTLQDTGLYKTFFEIRVYN